MMKQNYDNRVDTWAVGVLTYILMSGMPPFYSDNEIRMKFKICKEEF